MMEYENDHNCSELKRDEAMMCGVITKKLTKINFSSEDEVDNNICKKKDSMLKSNRCTTSTGRARSRSIGVIGGRRKVSCITSIDSSRRKKESPERIQVKPPPPPPPAPRCRRVPSKSKSAVQSRYTGTGNGSQDRENYLYAKHSNKNDLNRGRRKSRKLKSKSDDDSNDNDKNNDGHDLVSPKMLPVERSSNKNSILSDRNSKSRLHDHSSRMTQKSAKALVQKSAKLLRKTGETTNKEKGENRVDVTKVKKTRAISSDKKNKRKLRRSNRNKYEEATDSESQASSSHEEKATDTNDNDGDYDVDCVIRVESSQNQSKSKNLSKSRILSITPKRQVSRRRGGNLHHSKSDGDDLYMMKREIAKKNSSSTSKQQQKAQKKEDKDITRKKLRKRAPDFGSSQSLAPQDIDTDTDTDTSTKLKNTLAQLNTTTTSKWYHGLHHKIEALQKREEAARGYCRDDDDADGGNNDNESRQQRRRTKLTHSKSDGADLFMMRQQINKKSRKPHRLSTKDNQYKRPAKKKGNNIAITNTKSRERVSDYGPRLTSKDIERLTDRGYSRDVIPDGTSSNNDVYHHERKKKALSLISRHQLKITKKVEKSRCLQSKNTSRVENGENNGTLKTEKGRMNPTTGLKKRPSSRERKLLVKKYDSNKKELDVDRINRSNQQRRSKLCPKLDEKDFAITATEINESRPQEGSFAIFPLNNTEQLTEKKVYNEDIVIQKIGQRLSDHGPRKMPSRIESFISDSLDKCEDKDLGEKIKESSLQNLFHLRRTVVVEEEESNMYLPKMLQKKYEENIKEPTMSQLSLTTSGRNVFLCTYDLRNDQIYYHPTYSLEVDDGDEITIKDENNDNVVIDEIEFDSNNSIVIEPKNEQRQQCQENIIGLKTSDLFSSMHSSLSESFRSFDKEYNEQNNPVMAQLMISSSSRNVYVCSQDLSSDEIYNHSSHKEVGGSFFNNTNMIKKESNDGNDSLFHKKVADSNGRKINNIEQQKEPKQCQDRTMRSKLESFLGLTKIGHRALHEDDGSFVDNL